MINGKITLSLKMEYWNNGIVQNFFPNLPSFHPSFTLSFLFVCFVVLSLSINCVKSSIINISTTKSTKFTKILIYILIYYYILFFMYLVCFMFISIHPPKSSLKGGLTNSPLEGRSSSICVGRGRGVNFSPFFKGRSSAPLR